MRLEEEFTFTDKDGKTWPAVEKMLTDGASIPRALWTLVGSPFTGAYRKAAIVHDAQCYIYPSDSSGRRAADEMFYEACRAGGCSAAFAYILYLGVRLGAILGREPDETGARLEFSLADQELQERFRHLAEQLVGQDGQKEVVDDASAAVDAVEAALRRGGLFAAGSELSKAETPQSEPAE